MSDPTPADGFEQPIVHETALSKSMVFSDIDIQSRMSVARPDELQFEYTRLMMGVLLFQPQPKRGLMVGLGGGLGLQLARKWQAQQGVRSDSNDEPSSKKDNE